MRANLSRAERSELASLVDLLLSNWMEDNPMKRTFESISRGLKQAISHAKGRRVKARIHTPRLVDVASLRQGLGMTQEQFAARFGFSVATLRHWERGDRKPQGAALVLLNVIDRNPKAVMRALRI
jgi:putative transcriptional regulator